MAENAEETAKEVVLEKPDEISADGFENLQGQAGLAPDDELNELPDELPQNSGGGGFKFTREAAPVEKPDEGSTFEEVQDEKITPWFKDRRFMSILGSCVGVAGVLIFILFYLSFSENNIKADYRASKQLRPTQIAIDESYNYEDMSKIDGLIQKANTLYLRGEVEQALKIYEQISVYNEALSNYNLGVSQMNEGNFAAALNSFKKAIENGENQSVSAINAGVAALKLGDVEKFKYYIDLAEVYLSKEGKSTLYDYYLSLINYYKGYYPEALQMFSKTRIEPYTDSAKYLSAKIYSKIGLNEKAINELLTQGSYESSLSLGLLYARMGDFGKAKLALNTAMKIERDFNKSLAAISLVDLKTGDFADMTSRLENAFASANDRYKILSSHKIKANLNKELFNISLAQNNFSKDLLKNQADQFDLIFYFAPYEVFDSKQAALYIKKANISAFVDDSVEASNYISTSKAISSTNVKMASIINLALNQNLRQANAAFEALLKEYPQHSILHYNLGLTYAQLKNYELAHHHFASSYHLNPKNYQAGAFAMLTGQLSDINTNKFFQEMLENIGLDRDFKAKMQRSMLFLANADYLSALPYLDESNNESPLSLIFEAIIAKANGLNNEANVRLAKLNAKMPEDIISNILYFNSLNESVNMKEYAQNAQIHFDKLKLDYRSVFGGPNIAREHFVALMYVAGLTNAQRQIFKDIINRADKNEEGILQALAFLDIFAGQFEESYALYNTLIDEYKIKDARTLFLAAVAATGAGNANSAIALLQLSKLSDKKNKESLAALGFLYQEVQNYEAALNQYKELPNNFKSKFFSFDLVN